MGFWIVVVDDEAMSLKNIKNLLADEDIRVSCLRSGDALLRYAENNSPDLVILDILMPGMDGFETFEALRRFEDNLGRSHIPVIFLTGDINSEMEERGLKAGAADFIHKPVNRDILISRIRNTIINTRTIETLTEEATVDKLTGFLNKASGSEKISAMCAGSDGILAILDLDNFKLVNDLFGHDSGDRMLRAFSDIIRQNTHESDIISRMGGDEFIVFFTGISGEDELAELTGRINGQLFEAATNILGREHGLPLGISVGAVCVPEYGREYDTLFGYADSALYLVKQNGKRGYALHNDSSDEAFSGDLEKELARISTIVAERNDCGGALVLGCDAFSMIYRFILRFYKRYGGCSAEILFSLSAPDGTDEAVLNEGIERFGHLLQKTLRKSDLILHHRSNQYYVVLTERSSFEVENVINRIESFWKGSEDGSRLTLSYSHRCMEYAPQKNGHAD